MKPDKELLLKKKNKFIYKIPRDTRFLGKCFTSKPDTKKPD